LRNVLLQHSGKVNGHKLQTCASGGENLSATMIFGGAKMFIFLKNPA